MSRVFVATDLELDRQVVVKILPPDLSAGLNPDRFRREIQLAARLQHPHIVPLLNAVSRGGLLYFTMPYISGENLRTRLARTRELPITEATRFLRDVAEALSYAHSQGVVHRDIKPENILISGNHAVVLDFGVSKALTSATAEPSAIPAAGEPVITSLGVALGTPTYMAPEQAIADPKIDHRADIYALGIVAYELLTGRTPFIGMTPQQTLSAQLNAKPALITDYRSQVPPGLAGIIMRCLAKNPADRWQSADELYNALEPYSVTSGSTTSLDLPAAQAPFKWTKKHWAIAGGIAGVITALVIANMQRGGASESLVVGSTRQITNAAGMEVHPSISPDGKMIAYVVNTGGRSQLFVRQSSGGRAIPLTDSTLDPRWPQWNGDGFSVYFTSGTRMMSVPAFGGTPMPVSGLNAVYQCSPSHSGDRFICGRGDNGGLVVLGKDGGGRKDLTDADRAGVFAPSWSPDDKYVAYVRGNGGFIAGADIGNIAPSTIWVMPSAGGTPVRISDETHLNTSPVWTQSGDILFVSSLGGTRDVYLQRLNSDRSPRGEPVRLTTGLNPHTISITRDGNMLAYSVFTTVANIWSAPGSGSAVANAASAKPVTTGNQTVEYGTVSPDGQWLAYDSNVNGNQDIYKVPLNGGEPEQLTKNDVDDFHPAWSPDGKEIVFYSVIKGTRDIYVMNADGSGVRPVVEGPGEQRMPAWHGDGDILYMVFPDSVFEVKRTSGEWDKPSLASVGGVSPSTYSPDGKWLVHVAEAGVVCGACPAGPYIASADGSGSRPIPLKNPQLLTSNAGAGPWSRDSRHFYSVVREANGTSSIWQLPVNGDEEKRIFHFTDPMRQLYRSTIDVFGNNFYFTIGDRQSDVWMMELKKR